MKLTTTKMRRLIFQLFVVVWLALPVIPLAGYCGVTVILTRHAEKAELPAKDPPLSPTGARRANLLARILADSGVDTVFVSEYLRTQQTAQPLAVRDQLKPQVMQAADTDAVIKAVRARSNGVVLIVGHSDTLPVIIAGLGGPIVKIAETDFDNLFVLTLDGSQTSLLRLHYGESPTATAAVGEDKEHVVQIKFMRSGGFAGMATSVEGTVTIRDQSGDVTASGNYHRALKAPELELLREAADSKRLQAAASQETVPDAYQYDITATLDDGKTQTVTLHGEPTSGHANALLAWVAEECQRIWDHRINAH